MKKKIIFQILLILILIFGMNDIYAESIGGDNWQRHSNSSRIANFTLTSGMQQDFIINNDKLLINFGNYDTLTGQVNIINKTTNATYTNNVNINWLETCSHSNTIDSGSNYVITYADGTQATIGGTIYSNFCNQYNETGTVSLTYVDYNFDNNPGVFVSLRNTTDTFEIPCDFNGNTFKCKKYQYSEFDMLRIRIMAKGQTSQYLVSLNNTFSLTNDTNNAIINNNNTNWNNFNNTDISNQAKQNLDTTNLNDAQQKQNQAISGIEQEINTSAPSFWQTISIWIDQASNNWIFTTMQGILNTHALMFTFVFTILTLGLAKFILGRG